MEWTLIWNLNWVIGYGLAIVGYGLAVAGMALNVYLGLRVVPRAVVKETTRSTYREGYRASVVFSSMDVVTPSKPELNESGHSGTMNGAIAQILPKLQARLSETPAAGSSQSRHDLKILIKMCEFGMDEYNK